MTWYKITNEESVFTPALLVYPDRILKNIRRMIEIAGSADRLRPHVKTYKMGEVVNMQVNQGIHRFKCATLSEMKMAAQNGGRDILLAYPQWGPGVRKFFDLCNEFPDVQFAVTIDAFDAGVEWTTAAIQNNTTVNVFIDVDNGMHRTGASAEEALDLAEKLSQSEWLNLKGLHIYDGHIHIADPVERGKAIDRDFLLVEDLIQKLKEKGIDYGELACGGSFSFPFHAKHKERTLCPGTTLLWDAGYKKNIPELDFLNAAVLAGRVVSKPGNNICLDLGHKAVAAEMPHPRMDMLNMEADQVEGQSEEHLVVRSTEAPDIPLGAFIYTLPYHICPTVALYDEVYVVREGEVMDKWKVVARKRFS